MTKPILCVDFDGVIHSYKSGWKGTTTISDPPVEGAFAFLLDALEYFDVCIYSSRSSQPGGITAMKQWLYVECGPDYWFGSPDAPGLENLRFPAQKPAAFLTIDDRAICFDGDWSKLRPADLLNFKPWNKS